MMGIFARFLVGVALILISSESLLSKEYLISPSVGIYNELNDAQKPPTIDGEVFFCPIDLEQTIVLKSNRLLLQKAVYDLSVQNSLTKEELAEVDAEFQAIADLIDALDFSKKMQTLLVGVAIVDAKAVFDLTWDCVSDALKTRYGDNIEGSFKKFIFDSAEQIVRTAIDIAIEYYQVETALFGQYLPEILKKSFGVALAVYDGVLSTQRCNYAASLY